MIINTVTAVVNPDMPKTNLSQPLFVYVPIASYTSKGIASYNVTDFVIDENGQVSLNFNNIPTADTVARLNESINNLGILYSNMYSDLNNPSTGLKVRVSDTENSVAENTQQINLLSEAIARILAGQGSDSVKLVKVTALPTENILNNSIYELTYNGLIYYFIYTNNIWVQLNSSYLYVNAMQEGQAPNVSVYGNNTIYAVMLSEGETTLYYVGADNIVRRILNDLDYNQVVESLIDINQSITETNEIAQTAQALATQAQTTATTAQTTANTAQNTANEALQKANASATALRFMGNLTTIASLPAPSAITLGEVYNITDAFTTTSSFLLGAGREYPAGTNVAIVQKQTGDTVEYFYDALSGLIDLSGYQTKIVGEVTITADQLTLYNDLFANITLTVEQMSVFLNSNIVDIDATALGQGYFVVYRGASVDDSLIYAEAKTGGASLNITVSQRVALYVYNDLRFENQSADDVIYDGTYNSLLDGAGRYRLIDNRIAETTTADADKYLTVDSSGNIVWASLPIYNGETE